MLAGKISETRGSRLRADTTLDSKRRSSIFDVAAHLSRPPGGSSFMSFCAPSHIQLHTDDHGHKQQQVKYENTYQMEPPRTFKAYEAEAIIKEVLYKYLEDIEYDIMECSYLTKEIAHEISEKVKALKYDRYKIAVIVNLGECKDQGIRCGSRCMWDVERDTWASGSYMNHHIFATAEVYAMYYE